LVIMQATTNAAIVLCPGISKATERTDKTMDASLELLLVEVLARYVSLLLE